MARKSAKQIFAEMATEVPAVKVGIYHFRHGDKVAIFIDGRFSEFIDVEDTGAFDYFPGVDDYEARWKAATRRALTLVADGVAGAELDLTSLPLSKINLKGASLMGACLSRASLGRANLQGADLRQADLRMTSFAGANLSQANLAGANLLRANLAGTDLRQANLCGANLKHAFIAYPSRWSQTKLDGATYDRLTNWPDDFDASASPAVCVD